MKIYTKLLAITKDVVLALKDTRRLLFYSDTISHQDDWPNDQFEKYLQSDGHLGIRMKQAFTQALGISKKALIIGSDCPYINSSIIEAAFDALDQNDLVIGPTFDGGYYMLGMKEKHDFLFENIPWSTSDVYPLTIASIQANKKDYWEGPKLNDIDYAEDWLTYLNQI